MSPWVSLLRQVQRSTESTGPQVHRVHRSTGPQSPQVQRSTESIASTGQQSPQVHRVYKSTESTGPHSPQVRRVHRSTGLESPQVHRVHRIHRVHRVHRSTSPKSPQNLQVHKSTESTQSTESTESTGPQSPQNPQNPLNPRVHRSTGPQRPIITSMVNCSLTLGYFPVAWKAALVDPRLKKACQSASLSNLRPVRDLQFISKLTERAVYYQTQEHLVRSELYPTLQSAYRAGHSTTTALLKVHNDILLNMDNQRVTLLVPLDLSSAFDTVDHEILLPRFQITLSIADTALQCFRPYLAGSSQRVLLNGSFSEDFSLPHGVQEGSSLGPLLFYNLCQQAI